jgi:hypothetical protein
MGYTLYPQVYPICTPTSKDAAAARTNLHFLALLRLKEGSLPPSFGGYHDGEQHPLESLGCTSVGAT